MCWHVHIYTRVCGVTQQGSRLARAYIHTCVRGHTARLQVRIGTCIYTHVCAGSHSKAAGWHVHVYTRVCGVTQQGCRCVCWHVHIYTRVCGVTQLGCRCVLARAYIHTCVRGHTARLQVCYGACIYTSIFFARVHCERLSQQ